MTMFARLDEAMRYLNEIRERGAKIKTLYESDGYSIYRVESGSFIIEMHFYYRKNRALIHMV